MAGVDPSRIQFIKGTLIASPTDLSAASPYGGTILGMVRDVAFHPGGESPVITAEEWGGAAVEVLQGSSEARLALFLRTLDPDAIAAGVPTSEAGESGERPWIYQPGKSDADTHRPGRRLSESHGITLCVAPRAPDRQPFLVLYRAVPTIPTGSMIRIAQNQEVGIPLVWRGLLDDAGRVFAFARREDITL